MNTLIDTPPYKVYGSVQVGKRVFTLRDLREDDIEAIVCYWHDSEPEYLESLGVDLNKLKNRDATAAVFRASLKGQRGRYDRATLVFAHDDKAVGYTNINYKDGGVAYAHVHVIYPEYRNIGFVSKLFETGVRVFLTEFPTNELRFQTNAVNRRINRYLEKLGMSIWQTEYVANPDGMARPGTYHLYIVDRQRFVA